MDILYERVGEGFPGAGEKFGRLVISIHHTAVWFVSQRVCVHGALSYDCWDVSSLLVRPSYVPTHPVPSSIFPVPNVNSGIPTDTRTPLQETVSYRRNLR